MLPAHREIHLRAFARATADESTALAEALRAAFSALDTRGSAIVREHGPDPSRDGLIEFTAWLEPAGRVGATIETIRGWAAAGWSGDELPFAGDPPDARGAGATWSAEAGVTFVDPRLVWAHVDGTEAEQLPRFGSGDAVRWQGHNTVVGGRAAPPADRPQVGWTYAVKDLRGRYTAVRESELEPN